MSKITDHVAAALNREPSYFRGSSNTEAILTALLSPFQDLENAFWQILEETTLSHAIGAQLDAIGILLNEPRAGYADDVYRRRLKALVRVLRSFGRVRDILKVTRLLIDLGGVIRLTQSPPATVTVKILELAVEDLLHEILTSFLRNTASAGVRLIVESPTSLTPFRMAPKITFLSSGASSGVTSLQVTDSSRLIGASQLIIDEGTVREEIVTLTGISSSTSITCSTTQELHEVRASVKVYEADRYGFSVGQLSRASEL